MRVPYLLFGVYNTVCISTYHRCILPVSAQPTYACEVYAISFLETILFPILLTFGHQPEQFIAYETAYGSVDWVQRKL